MSNDIKKTLRVVVKNPEGTLFQGEAESLTTINKNGVLDVLPLHENFISQIQEKVVVHEKSQSNKEFKIQTGIIKVSSNSVQIFLDLDSIF